MDEILDLLNDKQREAVLHTEGALLVLAGAGSGKTRVITHRFAYLLREKPLSIYNILSVTFTNKAAGEMKERIYKLTNIDTKSAWIRTFHSMGVMLLRKNPEGIGYPRDFIIYDDTDSKSLVKSIMKDQRINTDKINPSAVQGAISSAKDDLIKPDRYRETAMSEFEEVVANVFSEYEIRLRKNRAVDFPDLISLPIELLQNNPKVLEHYQEQWKYVMVDEFQDTNAAQYQLIKLVGGHYHNICVVGDDDQSIYGWRGANIENIYDFRDSYKATIIPLEQNYRSTNIILDAANSVVEKISGRMPKKLWTNKQSNELIKIYNLATDREEAQTIVGKIEELSGRFPYRDFAVFYRTNAQSRILEETLNSFKIPYKVFGGVKFYDRKEIKDVLAYVKLVINPFEGTAFERVINVPKRKIGDVTLQRILDYTAQNAISYIETLLSAKELGKLNQSVVDSLIDLGQILLELNQTLEKMTPMNFVKILLDAIDYKNYILSYDEEGEDRWSNVEELINSIREFQEANPNATIVEFINDISLNAAIDTLEGEDNRDYVSLMTIHNAKGLEFGVVFISGVVDGLIPHINSQVSMKELYEERRLFYVAITRAKDLLYISYPETRMKFGDVIYCRQSGFLDDIPENLRDWIVKKPSSQVKNASISQPAKGKIEVRNYTDRGNVYASKKPTIKQGGREIAVSDISELAVGDTIKHKNFGYGRINFVSERMLKVDFEDFGTQVIGGNFISSITAVRHE